MTFFRPGIATRYRASKLKASSVYLARSCSSNAVCNAWNRLILANSCAYPGSELSPVAISESSSVESDAMTPDCGSTSRSEGRDPPLPFSAAFKTSGSEENPCNIVRLELRPKIAIRVPAGALSRNSTSCCRTNGCESIGVFSESSSNTFTGPFEGARVVLLNNPGGSFGSGASFSVSDAGTATCSSKLFSFCGVLFSVNVKSAAVSPWIGFFFESVTTTSTTTRLLRVCSVVIGPCDAGSCPYVEAAAGIVAGESFCIPPWANTGIAGNTQANPNPRTAKRTVGPLVQKTVYLSLDGTAI